MRILVADDDKVVSVQICGLLRQRGYDVTPVFDSTQAFMLAMRQPHPAGIVLDINMPGGNGVELVRKLKTLPRTRTIPILVVSGTTDPTHAATVVEHGAAAFLAKPLDPEAFCAAAESAFGPATAA